LTGRTRRRAKQAAAAVGIFERSTIDGVAVTTVRGGGVVMSPNLLWIIAVIVAIIGIIVLISGSIVWGIVLLIVAALIGPGGYSIFRGRMR
jgi:hypothetical protein